MLVFLQQPCVGLEPGLRDLGLRFLQARVAGDRAVRALKNHDGKKSDKKKAKGPGAGLAEVGEQGRKNEGVKGLKGKETAVTDQDTVFSTIYRGPGSAPGRKRLEWRGDVCWREEL